MFLIFINDLPGASNLLSWLFADDTALALSSDNLHDLEIEFNYEVNKVHDWLLANRLSVHYTDKTQFMLIKGPNKPVEESYTNFKLFMGNHQIEKTKSYKYFGVIVDENLNWKLQINAMCAKLSSLCGILSKVRHYLDRKSLMLIYNSLFDSKLRYGILGWGTASECSLAKLRVLQNRAVRFITFSPFRTSLAPLYSNLQILPLNELLFLQKSVFMQGLHYRNLPYLLSEYCHQPSHRYSTRYATAGNYVIPPSTTNRGQGSIKYSGPKAWTLVPKEIKEIAFRKPFAKKLKQHILKITYVELPPKVATTIATEITGNDHIEELRVLLSTEDANDETHGFETLCHIDLGNLFLEDSLDEEFFGF